MADDFIFIDNSPQVLEEFEAACIRALERCGMEAEGYAKDLCPVGTPESTGIPGYKGGTLRGSISHKVDPKEPATYVGTDVEYAAYVEVGTGIYKEGGGGRQDPWVYQDDYGNWHWTRGNPAKPYLKPAVADHAQTYRNIIEDEMKNG